MEKEETHKELYMRVGALETGKAVTDERFTAVMAALADIKNVLEKALTEIKTGYVTKEELKNVIQDGKYKKLWGGVIGSIITFIALALAGNIPGLN